MNLMNEWQPIETAPKDGTYILLYIPKRDALPYMIGTWKGSLWKELTRESMGWPDDCVKGWLRLYEPPKKMHDCTIDGIEVRSYISNPEKVFIIYDNGKYLFKSLFCPFCGEKA